MKITLTYTITLVLLCLLTSCMNTSEPIVYVDSGKTVYLDLAKKSDGKIEKLFQKIDSLEIIKEFNAELKVLESDDETQVLMGIIEASIEDMVFLDSTKFNPERALSIVNTSNFRRSHSSSPIEVETGYGLGFYDYCRTCIQLSDIREKMAANYEPLYTSDSITQIEKNRILERYKSSINRIDSLDYIVVTNDAVLVEPIVIDDKNFESGYLVTHVFIYDINTLEQVAQTAVYSTNSDEISFISYENNSSRFNNTEKRKMLLELNSDLSKNRRESVSNYLSFSGEEVE